MSMKRNLKTPDFIFETSWEVCNKVGGIYTVLSSRAKTLCAEYGERLVFVGPDIWHETNSPCFLEDAALHPEWREAAVKRGVLVRIGRWDVPGCPVAVLVDFRAFYAEKDAIYGEAWRLFGVDSLHAYGDYDEASMFSYAAGRFVQALVESRLVTGKVICQAHEWMSGLGMLFLKKACPRVGTIFTTHATSIGRSICGNDKQLYAYFEGYDGDQMARELNMEAKHSIEKQSAIQADCFTTVSTFTARECEQLLDKSPDVVLPNGFDQAFVPKGERYRETRRQARRRIFDVVGALCGEEISENCLLVSTSGRNDFRCKGFDVFLEAMAQLNCRLRNNGGSGTQVVSLIEVPCWLKGPREDLHLRLEQVSEVNDTPLPNPQISHDLYNTEEDRILNMIKAVGLRNAADDPVKVVLVPCYLDGKDGIFNKPYYDILCANDLAVYPSYYEPWGYTPLEAIAFRVPTVTTDLSGFGQWVNAKLGSEGRLQDGVLVLHRDDSNYFEVASRIADTVVTMAAMSKSQRESLCRKAAKLAGEAEWSSFIQYYKEAYDYALRQVGSRKK